MASPLRQVLIAETTNEIPVTQQVTSQLIIEGGGDYVWLAKNNQESLGQDIQWVFEPASCAPGHSPAPTDFRTVRQVDKGHWRIEKRTLTVSSLLANTSD